MKLHPMPIWQLCFVMWAVFWINMVIVHPWVPYAVGVPALIYFGWWLHTWTWDRGK